MDAAYRFRKNCERSDAILQRFLNPTEDAITEDVEYVEQSIDPLSVRSSKDNRVLVSSDGLYEYRPPVGLNVKIVKSESGNKMQRTSGKSKSTSTISTEQTIYLKSEPMDHVDEDDDDDDDEDDDEHDDEDDVDDDDAFEENDSIDVLYDLETNYEDSVDADKTCDSMRKQSDTISSDAASENDSKIMQIKPVRTNKVRLGHTSANKSKVTVTPTTKIRAISEHTSKENTSTGRTVKAKTNAKGEPKQPKKCEICGNTYMYQHALERYI